MPYDAADLSPVTEKNIAKVRAKENLARLRDFIGSLPDEAFNMDVWRHTVRKDTDQDAPDWVKKLVHPCNTVACIGGWGEALFGEKWVVRTDYSITGYHAKALGLNRRQSVALSCPHSIYAQTTGWTDITRRQAVRAIDNVIATGWPRWREAIKVK